MAETWVTIADPFGLNIAEVPDYSGLEYVLALDDVGVLALTLPEDRADLWALDNRVQVWNEAEAGGPAMLEGESVWLMRKPRWISKGGERLLKITAYHANHMLQRRIVAYNAQTAQAAKTGAADDVMKAIIRENLGASAAAGRNISTYLSAQADLGAGPTITKAFSRRVLLPVLQEVAEAAALAGTAIFFDIVAPTPSTLEFRTFAGVRGINRGATSGNPLIFSEALGNLADVEIEQDYSAEVNFCYGRGDGARDQAVIQTAQDVARIATSPLNRCEGLKDAGNTISTAAVLTAAQQGVTEGRPVRTFAGQVVQVPGCLYGVDYKWGDIVCAESDGVTWDCVLDRVRVVISGGGRTIEARLETNG